MVIEAKNSAGIRRFSYNSRHQQTRVETETGSVQENRYDAEGLRFELLENGRRTSFVYHDGELLQEEGREEQGTSYHLGAGMEAFRRGQELSYYHRDEQLSTALVTDGQGEIRNSYQYDAFGIPLETTEQLNNRIRYTGQQYDDVTGQYYLRARYYNPVAGRFMQEDVYQGDGLNLYAYCGNNPVVYDDPSGYKRKACPPQGKISESVDETSYGKSSGKYDTTADFLTNIESGNYSSLRELMLPEEVARYDEHWLDVAEKISNEALDNQIDFIKNGGITKPGGGAYKPAKISAAVDLNTGDIYFGYNGANKFNPSIQEIHPDLQQRINRTMSLAGNSIDNEYASRMSFEKWSVDNCAEIYSVNNALQNQATLDNIFINTKYFKDGKCALPCRNCRVTFEGCLFPKQ